MAGKDLLEEALAVAEQLEVARSWGVDPALVQLAPSFVRNARLLLEDTTLAEAEWNVCAAFLLDYAQLLLSPVNRKALAGAGITL